jgi:hypothetical protein
MCSPWRDMLNSHTQRACGHLGVNDPSCDVDQWRVEHPAYAPSWSSLETCVPAAGQRRTGTDQ